VSRLFGLPDIIFRDRIGFRCSEGGDDGGVEFETRLLVSERGDIHLLESEDKRAGFPMFRTARGRG